eukprot:TRINITY_DN6014_c0_g1_i1.p1 TRINITY_DN6014_c0_g1~~TRINITY_DN6014_c0_g1_i1.p1  ORF type:complete len:1843 (-),score=457.07 TRINITY_DN6014_c0_g1_i1:252-5714(-)
MSYRDDKILAKFFQPQKYTDRKRIKTVFKFLKKFEAHSDDVAAQFFRDNYEEVHLSLKNAQSEFEQVAKEINTEATDKFWTFKKKKKLVSVQEWIRYFNVFQKHLEINAKRFREGWEIESTIDMISILTHPQNQVIFRQWGLRLTIQLCELHANFSQAKCVGKVPLGVEELIGKAIDLGPFFDPKDLTKAHGNVWQSLASNESPSKQNSITLLEDLLNHLRSKIIPEDATQKLGVGEGKRAFHFIFNLATSQVFNKLGFGRWEDGIVPTSKTCPDGILLVLLRWIKRCTHTARLAQTLFHFEADATLMKDILTMGFKCPLSQQWMAATEIVLKWANSSLVLPGILAADENKHFVWIIDQTHLLLTSGDFGIHVFERSHRGLDIVNALSLQSLPPATASHLRLLMTDALRSWEICDFGSNPQNRRKSQTGKRFLEFNGLLSHLWAAAFRVWIRMGDVFTDDECWNTLNKMAQQWMTQRVTIGVKHGECLITEWKKVLLLLSRRLLLTLENGKLEEWIPGFPKADDDDLKIVQRQSEANLTKMFCLVLSVCPPGILARLPPALMKHSADAIFEIAKVWNNTSFVYRMPSRPIEMANGRSNSNNSNRGNNNTNNSPMAKSEGPTSVHSQNENFNNNKNLRAQLMPNKRKFNSLEVQNSFRQLSANIIKTQVSRKPVKCPGPTNFITSSSLLTMLGEWALSFCDPFFVLQQCATDYAESIQVGLRSLCMLIGSGSVTPLSTEDVLPLIGVLEACLSSDMLFLVEAAVEFGVIPLLQLTAEFTGLLPIFINAIKKHDLLVKSPNEDVRTACVKILMLCVPLNYRFESCKDDDIISPFSIIPIILQGAGNKSNPSTQDHCLWALTSCISELCVHSEDGDEDDTKEVNALIIRCIDGLLSSFIHSEPELIRCSGVALLTLASLHEELLQISVNARQRVLRVLSMCLSGDAKELKRNPTPKLADRTILCLHLISKWLLVGKEGNDGVPWDLFLNAVKCITTFSDDEISKCAKVKEVGQNASVFLTSVLTAHDHFPLPDGIDTLGIAALDRPKTEIRLVLGDHTILSVSPSQNDDPPSELSISNHNGDCSIVVRNAFGWYKWIQRELSGLPFKDESLQQYIVPNAPIAPPPGMPPRPGVKNVTDGGGCLRDELLKRSEADNMIGGLFECIHDNFPSFRRQQADATLFGGGLSMSDFAADCHSSVTDIWDCSPPATPGRKKSVIWTRELDDAVNVDVFDDNWTDIDKGQALFAEEAVKEDDEKTTATLKEAAERLKQSNIFKLDGLSRLVDGLNAPSANSVFIAASNVPSNTQSTSQNKTVVPTKTNANIFAWDLSRILRDPDLSEQFYLFQKKEFAHESYEFWCEVEKFRALAFAKGIEEAKKWSEKIRLQFLDEASPQQVNLPSWMFVELNKRYEEGTIQPYMFDQAQFEVWKLMEKDALPRFKRSIQNKKESSQVKLLHGLVEVERCLDVQQRCEEKYCETEESLQFSLACPKEAPIVPPGKGRALRACRRFLAQSGYLQPSMRSQLSVLQSNEKIERSLRLLDSQKPAREQVKTAIIYCGPGQFGESEVLQNKCGSPAFHNFVNSISWTVNNSLHRGFNGKIDPKQFPNGNYYASESHEIYYHVAPLMIKALSLSSSSSSPTMTRSNTSPSLSPSSQQHSDNHQITAIKRHIGNDSIHVIWCERPGDFNPFTIQCQFATVQIIIYPVKVAHGPNVYRIQVFTKRDILSFGPLRDGFIASHESLPRMIIETILSANVSLCSGRSSSVVSRQKSIEELISRYAEPCPDSMIANLFFPNNQKAAALIDMDGPNHKSKPKKKDGKSDQDK